MGSQEGYGLGEDGFEVLDRSQGDYFGSGDLWVLGCYLGSIGKYVDVGQCKGSGYFAQECGFLVIRFDECQVDLRCPDL